MCCFDLARVSSHLSLYNANTAWQSDHTRYIDWSNEIGAHMEAMGAAFDQIRRDFRRCGSSKYSS